MRFRSETVVALTTISRASKIPPLMNAPSFPNSGASLGLLFRQLRDAMWARMKLELANAGHDLAFSQYVTLKKLAIGSTGVTDLARAAELNPGAMTRLLARLEAKGLVARPADPPARRALNPDLTAAGPAIWQDINKRSEEHTSELQSLMTISYAVLCFKKKTYTQ